MSGDRPDRGMRRITMKIYSLAIGLVVGLALPGVSSARNWEQTTVQEETFDVGEGGALRIDVEDADLVIVGGGRPGVKVTVELGSSDLARARKLYDQMKLRIDADGNTVAVRGRRPPSTRGWMNSFGFGITIKVEVPTRFDVDMRTADGDITLQRVSGRLTAVTEDGDVVLARIGGQTASVRSSDGDIAVRGAQVASVSLETEDGDIRTEGIRSARLRLRTEDGDISIVLAENKGADVELRGEEVRVDGKVTFRGLRDDGRLSGRLNGGGPQVDAKTDDGMIRLAWAAK